MQSYTVLALVMVALAVPLVQAEEGLMDYIYKNPEKCPAPAGQQWLLVLNLGQTRAQCGEKACTYLKQHCAMAKADQSLSCAELPKACADGFSALGSAPAAANATANATATTTATANATTAAPAAATTTAAAAASGLQPPFIAIIQLNLQPAPAPTAVPTQPPAPQTAAPTAAPTPAPTAAPTPAPSAAPPMPTECKDDHESCCLWAKIGECDSNAYWMKPNCQKSCGTCGCTVSKAKSDEPQCQTKLNIEQCKDAVVVSAQPAAASQPAANTQAPLPAVAPTKAPLAKNPKFAKQPAAGCVDSDPSQCPLWAQNGECDTNPFWMKVNCQKSCQSCGKDVADINLPDAATPDCTNKQPLCQFWASIDECSKNPTYMLTECPLSCQKC